MEQNDLYSPRFLSALNVLIITLENCDGNEWNGLMDRLGLLYGKDPDTVKFLAVASSMCSEFASVNFWRAFPERSSQETVYLMDHRTALIAGASAAIAAGAMVDLNSYVVSA